VLSPSPLPDFIRNFHLLPCLKAHDFHATRLPSPCLGTSTQSDSRSFSPSPCLGTHDFHVKRLLSNLNKTHFAGREMGRESLQMKVMRLQARKEVGWKSLRIKSYALYNNKNDEKKILKKIFVFKAENL